MKAVLVLSPQLGFQVILVKKKVPTGKENGKGYHKDQILHFD